MSKILITGGAGFIGSNLGDFLIEKGNEVIVVDDLSMGKKNNLNKSAKLIFHEKSITDYSFIENLLIVEKFDYIYLLAAVASVADSIERPFETHQINQEANIFILETIRKNSLTVKKILFASSAAVYGNGPELPKMELSSIDPLTPYAIDKFSSERYVIDYGRLYGIPTAAVRFFNVYGPRQNPKSPYSGVLSLIIEAVKNRNVFKVFGDGQQTRDFVFVSDVIQALYLLSIENEVVGEVFNVGTGQEVSLNEIIEIVSNNLGESLQIITEPERAGDIKHSYADINKLSQLGFEPEFDIESGLKEYWNSLA